MTPSLYVTRSGMSNQCSSECSSRDRPRSNLYLYLNGRDFGILRIDASAWLDSIDVIESCTSSESGCFRLPGDGYRAAQYPVASPFCKWSSPHRSASPSQRERTDLFCGRFDTLELSCGQSADSGSHRRQLQTPAEDRSFSFPSILVTQWVSSTTTILITCLLNSR